jgi:hypothetical protein
VEGAEETDRDAAAMRGYAATLADALGPAVERWVERSVRDRWRQWSGEVVDERLAGAAREAAAAARAEIEALARPLLDADIDAQWTTPLTLLRRLVHHATAVLAAAGVPAVARDPFAERAFPEDRYDLAPANYADVDPELHEPGLAWGAAKAHLTLARRRAPARPAELGEGER